MLYDNELVSKSMKSIAFIDVFGLPYDGGTLNRRGLGGSESAVIQISRELAKIGYDVKVFNDCVRDDCKPGVYNDVTYIPLAEIINYPEGFDIMISSRELNGWTNPCSWTMESSIVDNLLSINPHD